MNSAEFGEVQPNPNLLEQFFINQQKVDEAVSQKGHLRAEHTDIVISYLFDNIETMADVSKGSRLESPGGSIPVTFGGVDEASLQFINKSWERIRDAESIQANAGVARKMLLMWASARHWNGAYNTIASQFVQPNLETVAKILRVDTVKEDFSKESVGEYERKYYQEVLDYIDSKRDSTDGYLEDFEAEKSKAFLQAVIADEKSDLSDVELAYKLTFADEELNDGASLAIGSVGARLQKAINTQDSKAAIRIFRILKTDYGDFAETSEFEAGIKEINSFILDNLESFSWERVDLYSPREAAMLFVGNFFDLLPAEKQKQYLENIQSILNKKASEGFESLKDLGQVSKQAAFLYREKRFEERKNQKEGKVGDLTEFIGENKPFIEAFFTTLNQFKESAKSPGEKASIREIEESSLPFEFRFIIQGNPELFIDEAHHYLSLLYPDGNVEQDVLTAFIKEPQSWLKIISNRLSNDIGRFDYVSGDFPNSPQKLTALMLKRLEASLSQSFPDSARSIHDIQDTVEASGEWNPGEPPFVWKKELNEQVDKNIQNHFFEIAHPFLVLGIGRDSNFQISEPQKEMIGQNLKNLWDGLSREEKRPILGLMLWSLRELDKERSQIHGLLVGTPDGIAGVRQRSTRSFNQLQNVILGLFSSFPTEEAVESRKDTFSSLTKRLWDSKDERIVYQTKEKLMKLRGAVLEKIEGTDLTVEQYIQTDDAWRVFKQLKSDFTL